MEQQAVAQNAEVVHSTFVVERTYPQSPERVFAAFAQPARKRRWYAEGDHEIQEFEMEFRVGGGEKFRYRFKQGHPLAGSEIANECAQQRLAHLDGDRQPESTQHFAPGSAQLARAATAWSALRQPGFIREAGMLLDIDPKLLAIAHGEGQLQRHQAGDGALDPARNRNVHDGRAPRS